MNLKVININEYIIAVLASCLIALLKPTISKLGIKIDPLLHVDAHINQMVQSCYFQRRRLSELKPFLRKHDLQSLGHACATSHLDYSNSVLFGVPSSSIRLL